MTDAELLGLDMDIDTDGGERSRAGLASAVQRAMVALVAVLLALGTASAQEPPDTIGVVVLEVVVDADYPTGIFVTGYPTDSRAEVGRVYELKAWPIETDQGPLPGYVKWSSADESVTFHELDNRRTLVAFTEPRDSVLLQAALHPFRQWRPET